jgi:hypothetical protein
VKNIKKISELKPPPPYFILSKPLSHSLSVKMASTTAVTAQVTNLNGLGDWKRPFPASLPLGNFTSSLSSIAICLVPE